MRFLTNHRLIAQGSGQSSRHHVHSRIAAAVLMKRWWLRSSAARMNWAVNVACSCGRSLLARHHWFLGGRSHIHHQPIKDQGSRRISFKISKSNLESWKSWSSIFLHSHAHDAAFPPINTSGRKMKGQKRSTKEPSSDSRIGDRPWSFDRDRESSAPCNLESLWKTFEGLKSTARKQAPGN
jgi:hypothetical protein